ncbi:hypothetical protein F4802DRAFT_558403 [Xylaria palmicola]|nr:hypothetical protein F4802DRAFT_558403 [Xylaria palmicola]
MNGFRPRCSIFCILHAVRACRRRDDSVCSVFQHVVYGDASQCVFDLFNIECLSGEKIFPRQHPCLATLQL